MKKVFVIFLFISLFRGELIAQGVKKFQVWTDFTSTYIINEKWVLSGELGYRFQPSTTSKTLYFRPSIIFKPTQILKFTAGLASFNNWEPQLFKSTEFRTFQYIHLSWPTLGAFKFKHRLGLDQRWFYIPKLGYDDFVHRSRYYVEVVSPNFNVFGLGSPFYITANFETLRDINNSEIGTLADHNRFTIGIGNHITERFKADVRFKIITLSDPLTSSFIREVEVLRVRLYYQFASS